MVSYTQNELLSITDFAKSLSRVLGEIKEHSLEKVGVLKNNKLEAIVIATDEYERLKEIEALAEHYDIFKTIQERKETSKTEYLSFDDMAKKFDINMSSL